MANDSIEIVDPFEFHPCDTPRGCLYYNTSVLTDDQQYRLNDFKNNVIRSNQKYLRKHPEVRAINSLILQYVFKKRPRKDIHLTIKEYLSRPIHILRAEINNYIISHNLTYEEEEEEQEEESPSDYHIEDYYKGIEEEEESKTELEKVYSSAFSFKSKSDDKFISELVLEEINEFPSPTEEEYEDLGFNLYETELSKVGIIPPHIDISASPLDEVALRISGQTVVEDVPSPRMSAMSGISKTQTPANQSESTVVDKRSQNLAEKLSNLSQNTTGEIIASRSDIRKSNADTK